MVVGERLSGGADCVQGVALGTAAARGPLGPADLHNPLAMGLLQEGGQAGAVAAGALHRPAAPTRHLRLGEVEQAAVAGRVGARRGLGEHAAHRSVAAARVSRWVSTPMIPSMAPASLVIAMAPP